MGWIEILGYAASGAVFVTFLMKTIITLRVVAMIGNVLYLTYGIHAELGNIILLHGALLPLPVHSLFEEPPTPSSKPPATAPTVCQRRGNAGHGGQQQR